MLLTIKRHLSLIIICCLIIGSSSNSYSAFDQDTSNNNAFINANNSSPTQSSPVEADNIETEEFLPVDEAYVLNVEFEDKPSSTDEHIIRINWQIAAHYYLYRHSFNFTLENAQSELLILTEQIPDGLAKVDDYFGNVEVYYHNADILLTTNITENNLLLTVTAQGCADAGLCYPPRKRYFQVDTFNRTIAEIDKPNMGLASNDTNQTTTSPKQADFASLPYMLLLAILGGSILNLMPCVFPILSLKVLGFANDKGHSQSIHGLTYTAGVVLSFILVATILVSLQAAGEAIGWGFHLQSPWFVAALAYLFFTMGLSLSGMIEFGGKWMNTGSQLASKPGYNGSFFTGVLATIVASPCTAPLMGTALGFAVTQPPIIAVSVFACLGFGMALPVLLLSLSPRLLNKIPKPGPWMDKLKQILAFPLYATSVWLIWVVGNQTGVNGMGALLLGCVLIAFSIWLWKNSKTIGKTIAVICSLLTLSLLANPLLTTQSQTIENAVDTNWQAYSPQKLSDLRQQGKPVFINVTADWCITCLANEKVALGTDAVKQAFIDHNITYLKADWTNYNAEITDLLKQHNRNGIPLYLVYSGNGNEVQILPQLLTTNTVLNALATINND
jgi:thiol:disulfide interchange protein DsbD